jgi:hypothetical protein
VSFTMCSDVIAKHSYRKQGCKGFCIGDTTTHDSNSLEA